MSLWGGRFSEPSDEDLRALNDSIDFDIRFYREDIEGSMVYALALSDADVITSDEAQSIVEGLRAVLQEFETGDFELQEDDEDIHTAVERRLTEIVGDLGGKLHTGRSRNDQVATDFRLWCMRAADRLAAGLRDLQMAIVERSESQVDTLMPGYTHLQPAQPVTVAHWLMSFFWMLDRDQDRLQSARQGTAVCPLGAGALAGNPFGVDRQQIAADLGFEMASQNSLDAVSDRDFVADLLYVISLCAIHLSRLAEDILIYSNPAFGFITLDDRYSTGSSLMPQKRNADPMELMRGKTGRVIGNLTGFLTTLKGLPSGYNKDLQEDKEALFDSCDTIHQLLPVMTAIVASLDVNADRMRGALDEELLATDLADYLVRKGMPFRQAHHVVGEVVRAAQQRQISLSQLTLHDMQGISAVFDEEVSAVFDFARSVSQRKSYGGTAPEEVRRQIALAKTRFAS